MIDLTVRDLTKTEDEDGAIDFIALTNPQWEMIKVNIDLLKNHEKCELMYVEDFLKILAKGRADAIEEIEKLLLERFTCDDLRTDWTNADIRETIHFELEQLKEQKNDD